MSRAEVLVAKNQILQLGLYSNALKLSKWSRWDTKIESQALTSLILFPTLMKKKWTLIPALV